MSFMVSPSEQKALNSMDNELGRSTELFGRNEDEWQRTSILLGSLMMLGLVGIAFGIYRTLSDSVAPVILIAASLALAGIAGYVFSMMKPTLREIEVFEQGLRIDDTRYPLQLGWSEIALIEESTNGESKQLLIQKTDETGYLVNERILDRYDEFCCLLREVAAANGIEHTTISTQVP